MAFLPLRNVDIAADAAARYGEWLEALERALDDPTVDRSDLCRDVLASIWYPDGGPADVASLSPGARIARDQLDPRNVTLEPEYYREIDLDAYGRVKPLLWMWEMFDRTSLGENVALAIPFRRLLAKRIFRRCGRNFKAFQQVKFSFGYNMEVGDGVVVHRHVLLDDRGGIEIGDGASISDYANVYSHSHDIVDGREVFTPKTIIGRGARITYHATILAGAHVADDSMVGAGSMLTRPTEPHYVYVGVPAKKMKWKPADARAEKRGPTGDPLSEDGPSALPIDAPPPPRPHGIQRDGSVPDEG